MNGRHHDGGLTESRYSRPLKRSSSAALGLLWIALVFAIPADATRPPPPAYGALLVCFEANRGQADSRFAFIARGQRHGIYLAADEAVITLAPEQNPGGCVRLQFLGARGDAAAAGLERLPGTVNYFLGQDPSLWRPGVPTFSRAQFKGIYPGVDLVYYSNERQFEYDLILAPGVDPRVIRLRFEGADALRVGPQGELVLDSADQRLFQHRPIAHQIVNGNRRDVPARYELEDARTVAFALGHYDTNLPLTIDPILSYSTYLGGNRQQNGWSVAVDATGAAIVAGETLGVLTNLPLVGFQTNFGGRVNNGGDAFVAKLNSAGTGFDYVTYLGGSTFDGAVSVAVDGAGNAYVAGYTTSRNFPVTPGVLQTNLAGRNIERVSIAPSDAFVAKLDPTGTTLLYSTYLGGTNFDSALGIAVDAAGAAHVSGYTESAPIFRRTNLVCVTRCTNSACGPTLCKTNVSRAGEFESSSVFTNILRRVITTSPPATNVTYQVTETTLLGVRTLSSGFPVTNAVQPFHGGASDVFVAKLNPDATALVYSTYLGGLNHDNGTDIAVDPAGNAYVTGWTDSLDFPGSTNAFQPFRGPARDAFVTSLDPAGALRYSTFLGGAGSDIGHRITADGSGSAYVTGAKNSSDFPVTPGALNRGGVFRSVDGAASWTGAGNGLTHNQVEALVRTPTGDLFAATPRGVFRSTDAGANWTVSFTSLSVNGVHALASDSTGTNLYAGTGEGLLVSTDAGATWVFESGGLGLRPVTALLRTPMALLAGTRGSGVLRSTNNADTWRSANGGLGNLNVNAFAVHPTDESILYAATDDGVFRSTNNGANWRGAGGGLTARKIQSLALDPTSPDTLYAGTPRGVFKSVNAGTNWTSTSAGLGVSNVLALALDPASPATLYAGTTNGLFKSLDAGATWTSNSAGLSPLRVKALLLNAANPGTLFAGLRGTNGFGGSNDVFLTKLSPDGSTLAYSLALGGRRSDQGWGVAVDAAGRAFVTGSTDSTNFPVFAASTSQQSTNSGRTDVFLAQFSPDGADLLFSIFLGGRNHDYAYGLALDNAGAAYLTGRTQSTNFPTTSPLQPGLIGQSDAFVAKVISAPTLAVARLAECVIVRWPAPLPGYALEGAENFTGPWAPVASPPVMKDGWNSVSLPAATAGRFFRLRQLEERP